MKYIIINGFPRSGKTAFINFCLEELGIYGINISTIDWVKYIAQINGWNGEKTPRSRKFLSDLKDLLIEWDDIPYKKVVQKAEEFHNQLKLNGEGKKGIVFIDCRESTEITKFENRNNAISVLIKRKETANEKQSNHADDLVLIHKYHYVIENDGTLEELREKAINFLKEVLNK